MLQQFVFQDKEGDHLKTGVVNKWNKYLNTYYIIANIIFFDFEPVYHKSPGLEILSYSFSIYDMVLRYLFYIENC